jgi:hypothetical protein
MLDMTTHHANIAWSSVIDLWWNSRIVTFPDMDVFQMDVEM